MNDCIDSFGEAAAVSTSDPNSRYWQAEVEEIDRDKISFTSHHGLYRFVPKPFGLEIASGTFQRAMDVILFPVRWCFA